MYMYNIHGALLNCIHLFRMVSIDFLICELQKLLKVCSVCGFAVMLVMPGNRLEEARGKIVMKAQLFIFHSSFCSKLLINEKRLWWVEWLRISLWTWTRLSTRSENQSLWFIDIDIVYVTWITDFFETEWLKSLIFKSHWV